MKRKSETDFQAGELCLYEEDGSQLKCEILNKILEEGGKILKLELRVLAVIKVGPFGAIEEGKKLEVWKRLDCWSPALWRIKEFSQQNLSQFN